MPQSIFTIDFFSKVLCDVPCFTDRHVIHEDENNIFHSKRKSERVRMPETQIESVALIKKIQFYL